MGRRGPFWIRSIRRRPSSFVILVLISLTATLVSVLAPLLLRAVDQSTLRSAVTAAGVRSSALTATAQQSPAHLDGAVRAATDVALAAKDAARFAAPVVSIESVPTSTWPNHDGTVQRSLLVAPASGCAGVRVVEGTCTGSDADVLVPSTARSGLPLGAELAIEAGGSAAPETVRLRISGFYDPARSPALNQTAPTSELGGVKALTASDLVVSASRLSALGLDATVSAVRRLRGPVGLDDVAPIIADLAAAQRETLTVTNAVFGTAVSSDDRAVFSAVQQQQAAAAVVILVVTIDAVILAWFCEALVVQRIGRDRAREWGVGRLRGMPRRHWLARIFVEPMVAVLLGAVLGVLLAVPVGTAIVAAAVHPVVGLEIARPGIPAAAALVVVGSLVALVAASARSARLPLPALLRETAEPRRISRVGVAAQTGVLLVTAAVLYALATQGTIEGTQIAALAPGLIPLVLGLVVLRIALTLGLILLRRSPRTLPGLVIARRLLRTPSSLYTALAMVVGVALATYTVDLALVSAELERQRATATVGAATVLTVTLPQTLSLLTAVDRADPSGTGAMAAEELTPANEHGTSRVLAIDTTRLEAVAGGLVSHGSLAPSVLARTLRPRVGPSLRLRGTTLRVDIRYLSESLTKDTPYELHLLATVQNAQGWQPIDLGRLRDGTVQAPIPCASGCRLVWVGMRNLLAATAPYDASITIGSISTDLQPSTELAAWLDPGRWRNRIGDQQSPPTVASLSGGVDDGLVVDVSDPTGSSLNSIRTSDAPEPLPAVLGADTAPVPYPGIPDSAEGSGLDSLPRVLHVTATAPVLPRLLNDGAMVDLGMMSLIDDPARSQALHEVWLSPGPHPAVLAALRAQGVHVIGQQTLQSEVQRDRAEAVPSISALSGTIGLAALLLTGLALVASRIIGVGDRRRDWRSLIDGGVSPTRLRRLLTAEVLLPDAVGAVIGGVAGIVAFALTAPHLPLLAGAGPTPAPDYAPPLPTILLVVAGAIAATAAVAAISARLELRRPDRAPR